MLSRRDWLRVTAGGAAVALTARTGLAAVLDDRTAAPTDITIYKSPTCGCCTDWVEHLEANGFRPKVFDLADVAPIKTQLGVPAALHSCHTGLVGGYAVEGHVPADLIQRLLRERPAVAGLAVPGMPVGSPGMEMGARKDPYDVVAFTRDGKQRVYAKR